MGRKVKSYGRTCEVCNKEFRSKYNLKLHMPVHTGEKNHVCPICRKSFQQKWNLVTHMARIHCKEKPFKCNDCGKAYGYSSHFKRHVKTHLVEKIKVPAKIKKVILNPYSCNECHKIFDSKYGLDMHTREHTGLKPYMCEKCGLRFTSSERMSAHMAYHRKQEFICDKCGDSFPRRVEIKWHFRNAHTTNSETKSQFIDLLQCGVCLKRVLRQCITRHMNMHYRRRVYRCRYCNKEYFNIQLKVKHEQTHGRRNRCKCDVCSMTFSTFNLLLAHRQKTHNRFDAPIKIWVSPNERDGNEVNTVTPADLSRYGSKIKKFRKAVGKLVNKKFEESKRANVENNEDQDMLCDEPCSVVDNIVPESSVTKQKMAIKEARKEMNRKIFEKIADELIVTCQDTDIPKKLLVKVREKVGGADLWKKLPKYMRIMPDNKVFRRIDRKVCWFCWNCDGRFKRRHLLTRHLLTHEPEDGRPYKCEQCQKTFTQLINYKEHIMSHNNERQYCCEKCGSCFRYKAHFNAHVKRHENVVEKLKNFECSYCGKMFETNFHRNEHVRTHTKEKSYLCKICGSRFADLSSRNRHSLTHTKEKPHLCKICGSRFAHLSSLNRHSLTHTKEKSYLCKICGSQFADLSSLNRHSLTHTKEKPYLCKICGSQFAALSTLNRHSLTHVHTRYQCEVCLRLFKHKFSLTIHRNGHSDKPSKLFCECGKSFSKKLSLKKHKMICESGNETVQAFECPHCPVMFRNRWDLSKHASTHNAEEASKIYFYCENGRDPHTPSS